MYDAVAVVVKKNERSFEDIQSDFEHGKLVPDPRKSFDTNLCVLCHSSMQNAVCINSKCMHTGEVLLYHFECFMGVHNKWCHILSCTRCKILHVSGCATNYFYRDYDGNSVAEHLHEFVCTNCKLPTELLYKFADRCSCCGNSTCLCSQERCGFIFCLCKLKSLNSRCRSDMTNFSPGIAYQFKLEKRRAVFTILCIKRFALTVWSRVPKDVIRCCVSKFL